MSQHNRRFSPTLLLVALAVLAALPTWLAITLLVAGLLIKFGERAVKARSQRAVGPRSAQREHNQNG